jgi:hypothetical protein
LFKNDLRRILEGLIFHFITMLLSSFKNILFLVFLSSFTGYYSQSLSRRLGCGTPVPTAAWDAWFNQKVEAYKKEQQQHRSVPVTITIPVIVHVLHGGQSQGIYPNISANQINSQITVLNEDFNGSGYNVGSLAATGFSAVGAATTNINFCLAQIDPQGNTLVEPGIDRINYNTNGWANPNSFGSANNFQTYMNGTVKPATIWDPTQYFNIWISDVNPSAYLLGYATFPAGAGLSGLSFNSGTAADDGIWIWSRAFGKVGVLDGTYNKGRTAVHEVGHWLGLRHIGGDANNPAGDCNATDYCADTPAQKGGFASGANGQNFGSPSYPLHVGVCGSAFGDMFMNFMDYCDDGALNMFTPNQNERMQTALLNGVFRSQLGTSSMSLCTGLPFIDFSEGQTGCAEVSAPLDFQTTAQAGSSYSWSAIPAAGVLFLPSSGSSSPSISFPTPGSYTVLVTASNTIGISSSTTQVQAAICAGLSFGYIPGTMKIWPNPASESLLIDLGGYFQNQSLSLVLTDIAGQEVYRSQLEKTHSHQLSAGISGLPDGMYIITISSEAQRIRERLIIRH